MKVVVRNIYRVRLWVLKKRRRQGLDATPIEDRERLFFNNLESAMQQYGKWMPFFNMYASDDRYLGFIEIRSCRINENSGTIALQDEPPITRIELHTKRIELQNQV